MYLGMIDRVVTSGRLATSEQFSGHFGLTSGGRLVVNQFRERV